MNNLTVTFLAFIAFLFTAVNSNPIVSIVIPTNSRPEFLENALSMINKQDYIDNIAEVVVVDDSFPNLQFSIEKERKIREEMKPKLIYLRIDHTISIGEKRNIGNSHITSEYILHWDDDDYYNTTRVSKQMEPVINNQADITILPHKLTYFIDDNKLLLGYWGPSYATLLYPRRAWIQYKFKNISLAEDLDFVTTIIRDYDYTPYHILDAKTGISAYVRHGANSWNWKKKTHLNWMEGGLWKNPKQYISNDYLRFSNNIRSEIKKKVFISRRKKQPTVNPEQPPSCDKENKLFRGNKVKIAGNSVDNKIQKIFFINKDSDVERREFMENQLNKTGIPYERFTAIEISKSEDLFHPKYKKILKRGLLASYVNQYNLTVAGVDKWINKIYEDLSCTKENSKTKKMKLLCEKRNNDNYGKFYKYTDVLKNSINKNDLGPISVSISHELLLRRIRRFKNIRPKMNTGVVLILEDDSIVLPDIQSRLNNVLPMVPDDFDTVRIGYFNNYHLNDELNKCVLKPSLPFMEIHKCKSWNGYYFGSHAYLVSLAENKLNRLLGHLEKHPLSNAIDLWLNSEKYDGSYNHYILKYPLSNQKPCTFWKTNTCLHNQNTEPVDIKWQTGWVNFCTGANETIVPVRDCLDYHYVKNRIDNIESKEYAKFIGKRRLRSTSYSIYDGIAGETPYASRGSLASAPYDCDSNSAYCAVDLYETNGAYFDDFDQVISGLEMYTCDSNTAYCLLSTSTPTTTPSEITLEPSVPTPIPSVPTLMPSELTSAPSVPTKTPTKCHSNMNAGDSNYCSVSCPCCENMGDCDNDDQCEGSLKCVHNVGKRTNKAWSSSTDVCHKSNWKCEGKAQSEILGSWHFCTSSCKCGHEQGDCDSNSQCIAGTRCVYNIGKQYGYYSGVDLCLSYSPTKYPTKYPTRKPTKYPTKYPTRYPSGFPTKPTRKPTRYPTPYPTLYPTDYPTNIPSISPTECECICPTDTSSPSGYTSTPSGYTPSPSGYTLSPSDYTPSPSDYTPSPSDYIPSPSPGYIPSPSPISIPGYIPSPSPLPPPSPTPSPPYIQGSFNIDNNSGLYGCSQELGTSPWYSTLNQGEEACNAIESCTLLHDANCDGINYRLCTGALESVTEVYGGSACFWSRTPLPPSPPPPP